MVNDEIRDRIFSSNITLEEYNNKKIFNFFMLFKDKDNDRRVYFNP